MKRASAKHDGNLIWLKTEPVPVQVPARLKKTVTQSVQGFPHPV